MAIQPEIQLKVCILDILVLMKCDRMTSTKPCCHAGQTIEHH